MSYCYTNEYRIKPLEAFQIIRKCPKCGKKTNFVSTKNFRVNANGKTLDIWLIYQCEKCKHSYNLTIFERVKTTDLDKNQLHRFMINDAEYAFDYGTDKSVFVRNHAKLDYSRLSYAVEHMSAQKNSLMSKLLIRNPYEMKLRPDVVLAEILNLSRSEVKRQIKDGKLNCDMKYIGKQMEIEM